MSTVLAAVAEIEQYLTELERNTFLIDPNNFGKRADALDDIDFHIIDRIATLPGSTAITGVVQRAEQLKTRLEEVDSRLFNQLHAEISDYKYNPASFRHMLQTYVDADTTEAATIGYNNLDMFVNALLHHQPMPEVPAIMLPDMVYYQKTPARITCQLAEQLTADDVFVDIGAGLGQVAMLVHMLSGAECYGIEYETTYCTYANTCAVQLNLPGVTFINTDAREADYSTGTVFFMYTPFVGDMLLAVLARLEQEARQRPIHLFTYGPCSAIVAAVSWLVFVAGEIGDVYALCEFKG